MNDLRKAAEMALEFVSWFAGDDHSIRPKHKAPEIAEALRKALAEEALDRMAAENQRLGLYDDAAPYTKNDTKAGVLHKEWVGLTEEEIFQVYKPEMEGMPFNEPTLAVIAGYLEAKLKEKNT